MRKRKEEIIDLAVELVKSRGFDSFSYSDLSKKLGIAKASVHHHFPAKEDLGAAILENFCEKLTAFYDELNESGLNPWDKLDKYMERFAEEVENGAICPLSSLQAEANVISEKMRDSLRELEEYEIYFVSGILEEGREKKEMKFDGSPSETAGFLVSALKGAVQYARLHGTDFFKNSVSRLKKMLKP